MLLVFKKSLTNLVPFPETKVQTLIGPIDKIVTVGRSACSCNYGQGKEALLRSSHWLLPAVQLTCRATVLLQLCSTISKTPALLHFCLLSSSFCAGESFGSESASLTLSRSCQGEEMKQGSRSLFTGESWPPRPLAATTGAKVGSWKRWQPLVMLVRSWFGWWLSQAGSVGSWESCHGWREQLLPHERSLPFRAASLCFSLNALWST